MPTTVNTHDAKSNLSRLLAKVEKEGETVTICRNGEPVADLVPHQRPVIPKRDFGPLPGFEDFTFDPAIFEESDFEDTNYVD